MILKFKEASFLLLLMLEIQIKAIGFMNNVEPLTVKNNKIGRM